MQTTISHQITSVRYGRTLVEKQISKNDPDELTRISAGLNDAGATLAALQIAVKQFNDVPTSPIRAEKMEIAYAFFKSLSEL